MIPYSMSSPGNSPIMGVPALSNYLSTYRSSSQLLSLSNLHPCQSRAAHHHAAVDAGVGDAVALLAGKAVEDDGPLRSDADLDAARGDHLVDAFDDLGDLGDALAQSLASVSHSLTRHGFTPSYRGDEFRYAV